MVATQAWATRCAVEAGNTATVTGDVGDCSAAFTVEGTTANAEKLRAMRVQICGVGTSLGEQDATGNSVVKGDAETNTEVEADLDDSGYGFSDTCPAPPTVTVWGTVYTLAPEEMCDWFMVGRWFVMVLAGLAAIKILAGGV
jgi:hypothetical protein